MKRFALVFLLIGTFYIHGCTDVNQTTLFDNTKESDTVQEIIEPDESPEEEALNFMVTITDGDSVSEMSFDECYSYLETINENRVRYEEPRVVIKDGVPVVTEFEPGNCIDIVKLKGFLKKNEGSDIAVNLADFILAPANMGNIEKSYASLKGATDPYTDFHIAYGNGLSITIVDFSDFVELDGNKIVTSFEGEDFDIRLEDVVKEKTASFNTKENGFSFATTLGAQVTIENDPAAYCSNTYGTSVVYENEIEYVRNALTNLESEDDRIPFLTKDGEYELPDTYVEVSKDDQHLWFYRDGELVMESGVVTGNKGTMDTPCGAYKISYMSQGIRFDGGQYSQRWAKFTERGHGLHDATWRPDSDFEDPSTYEGRGSHGCVNLPLEFAKELYEELEIGTVVVVY